MPPTRRKPKPSTQPPLSFGPRPAKITKPSLPPPSSKPPSSKPAPPREISPSALEPPIESDTKGEDEGKFNDEGKAGQKLTIREPPKRVELDEAERRAKGVKPVDVQRYWRGKEEERKAKRVHQKSLSLHEKILRHFDLSSQYGPCIGIPRLSRWKRAERLGLHPPIEVLAVLLTRRDAEEKTRGSEKGTGSDKGEEGEGERAYVDELLRGGGGE